MDVRLAKVRFSGKYTKFSDRSLDAHRSDDLPMLGTHPYRGVAPVVETAIC